MAKYVEVRAFRKCPVNIFSEEPECRAGKNLKFLGENGEILTAGKSGKIPPGQLNGKGGNGGSASEPFQYYYHPDHLGSSSYITDASGEVYQHLEYMAFGETFVEEHSNTNRTPYLFNGKELDEETGLYYYGARYSNPKSSIWISVDALSDEYPNVSPYSLLGNNPINMVDNDGNAVGPAPNIIPIMTGIIKHPFSNKRSGTYNYGIQAYWLLKSHPSVGSLLERASYIRGADNVNKIIGKGRHPAYPLTSILIDIPISMEKGDILNEAYKIDRAQAERDLAGARMKEADNILGNIDLADATGVFDANLDDQTKIDLTNYEMIKKYGNSKNMSDYKNIFKGGTSKDYLKLLERLSIQLSSDMDSNKARIININLLDGPPIELSLPETKNYYY
ncbi:RHS repeat domain-containing protein [Mangrovivirga cuniculi]|nr:RHS repeat-associated core domain-containing protein [Mangrovivirga cuniculi]